MSALDIATSLAKPFEGLSLVPYRDSAGYPTIGFGTLLSRDKSLPLSTWPTCTQAQAEEWLNQRMGQAIQSTLKLCPVPLKDTQIAALADFCYNLGAGYLELSTLRKKILDGDFQEVPYEFSKWIYAGHQKLAGLIRRRKAESDLFMAA